MALLGFPAGQVGLCLAAGAAAGATTKGGWPAKLSAAAIACIKANLKLEKGFDLGDILRASRLKSESQEFP